MNLFHPSKPRKFFSGNALLCVPVRQFCIRIWRWDRPREMTLAKRAGSVRCWRIGLVVGASCQKPPHPSTNLGSSWTRSRKALPQNPPLRHTWSRQNCWGGKSEKNTYYIILVVEAILYCRAFFMVKSTRRYQIQYDVVATISLLCQTTITVS